MVNNQYKPEKVSHTEHYATVTTGGVNNLKTVEIRLLTYYSLAEQSEHGCKSYLFLHKNNEDSPVLPENCSKWRKSVFQARISGRLVSRTELQKKRTNIKLISIRISKLFIFFTACSLLFHLGEHQVHLRKETTAMCGEKTPKDFVCSIKWTLSFLLLHY